MIVLTEEAKLRELINEAVHTALAEAAGTPVLLDRQGLARALSVSPSTVDNMRKRGMPQMLVGDAPRFVLRDVLDWLSRQ